MNVIKAMLAVASLIAALMIPAFGVIVENGWLR